MADESILVSDLHTCYATYINTDLTEGRGFEYPRFICETYSTAKRLGANANVQGSNGNVQEVKVFKFEGKLYGPIKGTEYPSKEDDEKEKLLAEKAAQEKQFLESVEKAKSLGLSEFDLAVLTKQIQVRIP